jgi:predicted DNA-binding ribbon-helix-helix protein
MSKQLSLQKKSFRLSGHATSVALEPVFWEQLQIIADKKGISLTQLVMETDLEMSKNLASTLRLVVVKEIISENKNN